MPVRSKRLFGPVQAGTGGANVYTCPAGETAILKTLTMFNPGAIATTLTMGIGSTANANVIVAQSVGNGATVVVNNLFICLHPGETLRCAAGAGNITVSGHGAELEGVAD